MSNLNFYFKDQFSGVPTSLQIWNQALLFWDLRWKQLIIHKDFEPSWKEDL
jgi:hypothetical protein